MVLKKKRSPVPQIEHEPSVSTAVSVMQSETDWVSNAFRAAELASAVGGLLPFPYLKNAAELIKVLLKPVQQMQQNQDDYKTLTTEITNILQILHDETKKNHEIASDSFNSFEKGCEDFYQCLQNISNEIQSFNKPYKSKLLRKYFSADREKNSLARYQRQIEEFRINLVLRGMIRSYIGSNTDEMDSDYEKIRLGDLNVLKNISNGQVEHWEVRWKQESQTRMVRVYKGRDAISKFEKEKEWYSRYRHPNVMQLSGIITSKESPGLVFTHNSWCIPIKQLNPRSSDALGRYLDWDYVWSSFFEGRDYVSKGISHHAILSCYNLQFSCDFIGFKDREDGYLAFIYVNILDGRGLVVFEWSPNILQAVPANQWSRVRIDALSGEELTKIMERVDMLRLSPRSNVPLDPSFLWDLYGTIRVLIWRDVSVPAYSVYTGDILLADEHNDILDASNAAILGFIPCEEPSSLDWFVRDKILHTKLGIEDCGEHFRTRFPVDTTGISASDDLQTVVVECDVGYSDDAPWERLVRAFVSQIGCLLARTDGLHESCVICTHKVCLVTGISWHIQIPSRPRYSVGTSGYKELYFFISKPAVHDETLDTYWSLDRSGSERLYCSDMDTLGFDSKSFNVQIRRTLRVINMNYDDFEYIQEIHAVLGIDPNSDEAARILGLPLIRLIQPESDDVSDDSDQDSDSYESYHTAGDGEDEAVDEENDEADDEAEDGGGDEAEGGSVDAHETE